MMKLFTYPVVWFSIVIGVLILTVWHGCNENRRLTADNNRLSDNLHSIVQKPGKVTQEFDLNKKEFGVLFPAQAHELDSLKKLKEVKNRVQSFQKIVFRYVIDTVLQPLELTPDANPLYAPYVTDGNIWQFNSNCLTAELSKADSSELLNMKLSGEITEYIIADFTSPKWYKFWQLLHPNKWPVSTKVTTPCGLQIKENVKFNFK